MCVSVVMTVYNGERFLVEAVESVLNQTLSELELIIVDDGSTDRSPQILEPYAKRDTRVRLFRQDHRGVSAAANTGMRQAAYDLIARSDSDDRMLPHRLERQLAFLKQHPEVDAACSRCYFINTAGRRIGASSCRVDLERGKRELKPAYFVNLTQSTVLMKRDAFVRVGGYREEIDFAEDRDLWGRLATAGYTIACQDELLAEYRLHSGAMTMKRAALQQELCYFIDENVRRRLQGQAELSLNAFRALRQRAPLTRRLHENLDFLAVHAFKRASRHYGERQYFRFALAFSAAVSLNPIGIVRRAIDRIQNHQRGAAVFPPPSTTHLQTELQAPQNAQGND
ncbi:MAG TPA: glycosyltransferase family 2 protein [Bryobacteraceae bacterium]|jgi:glycosyltransferase involved in cell wall biosynthesis